MATPEERDRLLGVVPGASLIVLLGLGAVGTVLAEGFGELPDTAVHDGSWTTAWESSIDGSVLFRELGVTTWAVAEWVAFGDGRPGVVPGRDGWLFTDEEYTSTPNDEAEIARKLAVVAEAKSRLDAAGVTLVVALLPAKTRLQPEQLDRIPPAVLQQRYADARAAVEALGVPAPDLLAAMEAAGAEAEVFLHTDTHWTPHGADAVAAAIAAAVAPLGLDGIGESTWATAAGEPVEHRGDLLNFLPLGPLERLGPAADALTPRTTTRTSAAPVAGLFDDVTIPVTVVGTSYTQGELWNFPGALQQHLGAEVLDASLEGQGPLAPMKAYLDNEAFTDSPPALLIWEFPERYLRTPYDDELYLGAG